LKAWRKSEDAREEKKNDIKVNGVRENGVKFREFQTRVQCMEVFEKFL